MEIIKANARPSAKANADYFGGDVYQDPIYQPDEPARARSLRVTFMPGGRTNWHTHPLGQTLYVLSGVGRIQKEGEPVIEIREGDTVWIPPGEKHWHGAAPDRMMVHIAIQEALDGSNITWLEAVADEDYAAAPTG
ncbi:MAG: cupin domain-containing protein [Pseudomonadota bacterium]